MSSSPTCGAGVAIHGARSGLNTMLGKVSRALDGRRLIWFGTRGEDGEALLRLPELSASFAITAPLRSGHLGPDSNVTLENLCGVREDLDRHDIDEDTSQGALEFRRQLLRQVSGRCAVVKYRSARMVSTMAFSMTETMLLAGLFKDRQVAFEHKPWVETSLAQRGVRTLGWTYVADEHRARARKMAASGPLVLRASRASGGVGVVRADGGTVDELWPDDEDGFVGVSRFLEDAIPLNVSGCVYGNGIVRLHPPSLQVIGEERCTDRPFGYCGNDFGSVSLLPDSILEDFDALARTVGRWLHSERYLGAFGVDALARDGCVYFTEVNPRFQGSSSLSAEIAANLGLPDLFLEHLAASLGVEPGEEGLSLREWAKEQPLVSHLVVRNTNGYPIHRPTGVRLPATDSRSHLAQILPAGISALPGGVLARLVRGRSVTDTGYGIDPETGDLVDEISACFGPAHEHNREAAHVPA